MPELRSLPAPHQIALGYALSAHRGAWAALFELDLKLAGIVAQAREPLLTQIKLVWWRDTLALALDQRPAGEPLLQTVSEEMPQAGSALAGLATAWECLLDDAPLAPQQLREHCALRAAAYAIMAEVVGHADMVGQAMSHARWWALGDTLPQASDISERTALRELADQCPATKPLPRALRPLAVLSALGARAIRRDEPVLEGRGSALVALRVGMFGR